MVPFGFFVNDTAPLISSTSVTLKLRPPEKSTRPSNIGASVTERCGLVPIIGKLIAVEMLRPELFTRIFAVPLTFKPSSPISVIVPSASIAYWLVPNFSRAMLASLSITPIAPGFGSPFSSVTGPWPRKMLNPSPTKPPDAPTPWFELSKPTLPSMVTKSAMLIFRSVTKNPKTLPACDSACVKRIAMLVPFTSMRSSTAARVVLMRKPAVALTLTPPAPTLNFPEMMPAMPVRAPFFLITSAPCPSSITRDSPGSPLISRFATAMRMTRWLPG